MSKTCLTCGRRLEWGRRYETSRKEPFHEVCASCFNILMNLNIFLKAEADILVLDSILSWKLFGFYPGRVELL